MTTQQPQPYIKPPSDWKETHSRGLLRRGDMPDDCLVRLLDVVRDLMKKSPGLPPAEAVKQVCAAWDGERTPLLYAIDPVGWAKRANDKSLSSPVLIHRYTEGQVEYGVRRWTNAEIGKKHAQNLRAAWLESPTEFDRLKEKFEATPNKYDAGKETPLDFCDRVGDGPIYTYAVTCATAYECWGWGTIATPVADENARLTAADVTDIESLIRYRMQFKGTPDQEKHVWPYEHLVILWNAVCEYDRIHGRGGQAHYARMLGLKPARVWALLNKNLGFETEAEPEAAPQNPNDILRTLGKPGTAASNSGITSKVYHDGKEVTKNKSRFAA